MVRQPLLLATLAALCGAVLMLVELDAERSLLIAELKEERLALTLTMSTLVEKETGTLSRLINECKTATSRQTAGDGAQGGTAGSDEWQELRDSLTAQVKDAVEQASARAPDHGVGRGADKLVTCPPCPVVPARPRRGAPINTYGETLGLLEMPVHSLAPMPLVGLDVHPWRMDNLHSESPTRPTYLLSSNLSIESGDTSSCKEVDVHFFQTDAGRCSLLVPDRTTKTRLLTVPLNDAGTGPALPYPTYNMNPDGSGNRLFGKTRDARLSKFMAMRSKVAAFARKVLDAAGYTDTSQPIVVMGTNSGHVPMLLNWACSLRARGIKMPPHLVFVTSEKLQALVADLGFTAIYHPALGTFPDGAATHYADGTFGSMMFMKQFCVSVALETGHDVLFQDLDITWLHDPLPGLKAKRVIYHGQFQDDNSRSERFAPFFANSGFIYLSNNVMTKWFWEMVTVSLPSNPQGNQYVMRGIIELFVRNWGFKAHVLPFQKYQSGAYLSHPTNTPRHIKLKPIFPTAEILHFCWTDGMGEKMAKLKLYKELFVTEDCLVDVDKCFANGIQKDQEWASSICQVPVGSPPDGSQYGTKPCIKAPGMSDC